MKRVLLILLLTLGVASAFSQNLKRVKIFSIVPGENTGQDYSPWMNDNINDLVKNVWTAKNAKYVDVVLKLEKQCSVSKVSFYDFEGVFTKNPAKIYALKGTKTTFLGLFTGQAYKAFINLNLQQAVLADAIVIRKFGNNIPQKVQVYESAQQSGQTQAVISFPPLPDRTIGDAAFNVTATSTNTGTPIMFISSNPSVVSVSNATGVWKATILSAGSANITSFQAAKGNYSAADNVIRVQIIKPQMTPSTISFASLPAKIVGDIPFKLTATSNNTVTPIMYTSSNPSVISVSNFTGIWLATIVTAGIANISASQAGDASYLPAANVAHSQLVQAVQLEDVKPAVQFTSPVSTLHTYYVDTAGNDFNDGKTPATAWKTVGKASSYFPNLLAGDTVAFKRGQVFSGTLKVTKSGTVGSPIVISAFDKGNRPSITGSKTVNGWISLGNGIYEATLTGKPNLVSIDGNPYAMGRYPNSGDPNGGYLIFESAISNTSITDNQLTSTPSWTGAEVVIRKNRWVIDRGTITNHNGTTLTYNGTSGYNGMANWGYFIQNSFQTLDKFGEWFYNSSTGKIDVYFGSNTPANYSVRTSSISNIISATNISNVVVDNIAMEGADNYAVYINGGTNFQVNNCDISNTGINGLYYIYSNSAKIQNCNITGSQNSGIYFIYGNSSPTIDGNTIRNTYQFAGMGQNGDGNGVAISASGESSTITHNFIVNSGYIGIRFDKGSNITVKNNSVDSTNTVKDDGGGIYTFEGGSTVRSNNKVISNIVTNSLGNNQGVGGSFANLLLGYGLYMDLNSNNILIQGNTVNRCGYYQMFFNAGRNITIRNNTFYGRTGLVDLESINLSPTFPYLPSRNLILKNNIFFIDTAYSTVASNNIALQFINTAGKTDVPLMFASPSDIDSNYYCRPLNESTNPINIIRYGASYTTQNHTTAQWAVNSYGWDVHSHGSPITFTDPTWQQLIYNNTSVSKLVNLDRNYIDVYKNKYSGTITLPAYSSLVLLRDTSSNKASPGTSGFRVVATTTSKNTNPTRIRGVNGSKTNLTLEELETQTGTSAFQIYPNPSKGRFTVLLPKPLEGEVSYILVSMLGTRVTGGRVLLNKNASSLSFDLSREITSSGEYHLLLQGKELRGQVKLMIVK